MTYKIGAGKGDITYFLKGIGMMGYGQPHNYVLEVGTKLFARSLVIQDGDTTFVLINLEQAFITMALKDALLKELKIKHPDWNLKESDILFTAQHTHSAPGGYSHFPLYNFTVPGFRPELVRKIVQGTIESLEQAYGNLRESSLDYEEVSAPHDLQISFNRSMRAFLNNPEAQGIKSHENHLAVDRSMKALKVMDKQGKLTSMFNFFGVHCTSVSSFNNRIHHDNKGVAAELYETKNPGVIAAFLQAAAGDIGPHFVWDKKSKLMRGPSKDQYENASFNGEIQYNLSTKLEKKNTISGKMKKSLLYIDMEHFACSPAHGKAFFMGAPEGPGIAKWLADTLDIYVQYAKRRRIEKDPSSKAFYDLHEPKSIFLDHNTGEFVGIPYSTYLKFPTIPDPSVSQFLKEAKSGALKTKPWAPRYIPLHLIQLGNLLIIGVPGEITYTSGERLKKLLKDQFAQSGVEEFILVSYSNAFMGYITTKEEYQMQCYEGGHTIYGHKTLEAIMKGFSMLAENLKNDSSHFPEGLYPANPFSFPEDELLKRTVI
jgi:neutral ceramidase